MTACTFQTFSSTPSLTLLLLPLDDFALSHFYTPLPHMTSMRFLKNKALAAPPHACTCMWFDKMLKGHPMMYHGACMVRLTRLPPSMYVLMLITPLISKIKNKFRAMEELKHEFREGFKALKTNVSRKIFPTTFMLVSSVLFAFIS
jgi:hypothetical protein